MSILKADSFLRHYAFLENSAEAIIDDSHHPLSSYTSDSFVSLLHLEHPDDTNAFSIFGELGTCTLPNDAAILCSSKDQIELVHPSHAPTTLAQKYTRQINLLEADDRTRSNVHDKTIVVDLPFTEESYCVNEYHREVPNKDLCLNSSALVNVMADVTPLQPSRLEAQNIAFLTQPWPDVDYTEATANAEISASVDEYIASLRRDPYRIRPPIREPSGRHPKPRIRYNPFK